MEIGSEKCDCGIHLDEDCNKFNHVHKSGIRQFSSIDSGTQDILLWRSGLECKSIYICIHHEAKLGFAFETGSAIIVIHLRYIRSMSKGSTRYQQNLPRHV